MQDDSKSAADDCIIIKDLVLSSITTLTEIGNLMFNIMVLYVHFNSKKMKYHYEVAIKQDYLERVPTYEKGSLMLITARQMAVYSRDDSDDLSKIQDRKQI